MTTEELFGKHRDKVLAVLYSCHTGKHIEGAKRFAMFAFNDTHRMTDRDWDDKYSTLEKWFSRVDYRYGVK